MPKLPIFEKKMRSVIISPNSYLNKIVDFNPLTRTVGGTGIQFVNELLIEKKGFTVFCDLQTIC